jgi:hypothetical protein
MSIKFTDLRQTDWLDIATNEGVLMRLGNLCVVKDPPRSTYLSVIFTSLNIDSEFLPRKSASLTARDIGTVKPADIQKIILRRGGEDVIGPGSSAILVQRGIVLPLRVSDVRIKRY